MEYTLWRGGVLLGHTDLEEGKHPGVLHGPIRRTADLDLLGPISQHRLPDSSVFQHSSPRASEWWQHGNVGGDLDVIEIWDSTSETSPRSPGVPQVPPEQLLTVRSADGQEVNTDMIWVTEPPAFPPEVTEQFDAATRELLTQWRMMCRLSGDDSHAG